MKKRTLKLAAVSFLAVLALAGCSGSKDIATMKGGKVTEADFYEALKTSQTATQTLQTLVINKVIDNAYGSDVKTKDVDAKYDEYLEQYENKKALEEAIASAGYTVKSFKENIKSGLAFEAMLKAHLDITDDDLKETWATYHPSVDAQIISLDTEEDATAALKEITDGKSFDEVAKEKSTDTTTKEDGGKVTFDSTTTTTPEYVSIPDAVKEEAYKLEDGKVSGVITATNSQTGADAFYIVKMVKNQKKGNDYKAFEKELKEITETTKMADGTFQTEALGEELDKAKVTIKDDDFKSILEQYLPQKEETTSSSTSDATDASSEEATDSTK